MRSFKKTDQRPLRKIGWRYIAPCRAAIGRKLYQTIRCAGPDLARRLGRQRERVDRGPIRRPHRLLLFPHPRLLRGRRLFGFFGLRLLVARLASRAFRQIGADRFPMHSAIARLEQKLRAQVERVRVLRRKRQRRIHGHAIVSIAAHVGRNVGDLPVGTIDAHQPAPRPAGIDHVRIQRIGNDVSKFISAHRVPIHERDFAVIAAAERTHRSAVLLRPVNPIRKAVVGRHVIDLAGRLVVPRAPRFARVQADGRALIACQNHPRRVRGIDPQGVVVVAARRALVGDECPAAVVGAVQRRLRHIHHVRIFRIEKHPAEISAALNSRVRRAARPGRAAIVGAIQSARAALRRDNRKHALAVRRDGDSDTPQIARRQSRSCNRRPGFARIRRLINSRAVHALDQGA